MTDNCIHKSSNWHITYICSNTSVFQLAKLGRPCINNSLYVFNKAERKNINALYILKTKIKVDLVERSIMLMFH